MKSQWIKVAEQLYLIQQQLKEITAKDKEIKEELKKLSDYQSHAEGQFSFEKAERNGSINYNSISFLKEIDLEPFRNPPVEVWKLSVRALIEGAE